MFESKRRSSFAALAIAVSLGCLGMLANGSHTRPAPPEDAISYDDDQAAERLAIQKAMEEFGQAFEKGDAKTLAAVWTKNGEYTGDNGTTIRGRAAIEKAYGDFFAKSGTAKLTVTAGAIRFPAPNTAIQEGSVKVHRGREGLISGRYTAFWAKEDGQWRLAVLNESGDEEASLEDIEWLMGTWTAKTDVVEVSTTYQWWGNKSFIRMDFKIKEKDRTVTGFQLIGKDASTGDLRSWSFEADGGFGEATWSRDDKQWVLDAAGVQADGTTLTATNILTAVDDHSFIWHSTKRTIDGEDAPDLAPIKVTRVQPQK